MELGEIIIIEGCSKEWNGRVGFIIGMPGSCAGYPQAYQVGFKDRNGIITQAQPFHPSYLHSYSCVVKRSLVEVSGEIKKQFIEENNYYNRIVESILED